jgi:hypothetical protein
MSEKFTSKSNKFPMNPDLFKEYNNTQLLYELVPGLELPTRESFSTLSLKDQESLIQEVENKKKANVSEVEILSYVISMISAYLKLESISVSDSANTTNKIFTDKNSN